MVGDSSSRDSKLNGKKCENTSLFGLSASKSQTGGMMGQNELSISHILGTSDFSGPNDDPILDLG